MKALAAGPDRGGADQIDTSVVRVAWSLHRGQQSPRDGSLTRGLTCKIHAVVYTNGLPVHGPRAR